MGRSNALLLAIATLGGTRRAPRHSRGRDAQYTLGTGQLRYTSSRPAQLSRSAPAASNEHTVHVENSLSGVTSRQAQQSRLTPPACDEHTVNAKNSSSGVFIKQAQQSRSIQAVRGTQCTLGQVKWITSKRAKHSTADTQNLLTSESGRDGRPALMPQLNLQRLWQPDGTAHAPQPCVIAAICLTSKLPRTSSQHPIGLQKAQRNMTPTPFRPNI
jgi:hypothetical protein